MRILLTMFVTLTAAALVAGCVPDSPDGGGLRGPVTHIRDGDTIEVANIPVRLRGLTCDERGTALGESATRAVSALVRGREVSCSLTGEMTYDREVGSCSLPDGRDIGAALIAAGQCGRCNRYDPEGRYIKVQRAVGPFPGRSPGYCRS